MVLGMVCHMVMMVGKTWACADQGLMRLCVNLRSCGCVPTLDHVPLFNELNIGMGTSIKSHSK
jgi:hypothetical protein